MSIFDTPDSNAYTMPFEQVSPGPRLGFQDAFNASWEAQARTQSLLGVQKSFRDVEQAQIRKIREAGLTPPASLDESEARGDGPFGGAQFYQGRYAAAAQSLQDGGGWYTDEMVKERDDAIKKLQQERPDLGLRTYGEMFAEIQAKGKEAIERSSLPTTTLGAVGSFLGGAAASLDPRTDPLNVASFIATAPFGGPTVLSRVATQAGVGAVTEAANIAIGPDGKRIITGVPSSPTDNLARIGFAAAGGAGGQLLGEAVGMGVRRAATGKWFADVTPEQLPTRTVPTMDDTMRAMTEELSYGIERRMPPDRPFKEYPDFEAFARSQGYDLSNPYGPSRQAALRNAVDVDYVQRELNRWDGPDAHMIAARTDTALPPDVQPGVRFDGVVQRYIDNIEDVGDIARRLDPDTFRLLDKLERQRAAMRDAVDAESARFRSFEGADTFFEANADQAKLVDIERRAELQRVDQKLRDLAPLVSRATKAAEMEWRTGHNDIATLAILRDIEARSGWRFRGDGEPSLAEKPPTAPRAAPPAATTTPADRIPASILTRSQESRLRPGQHDAVDRVAIVVKDATETAEQNVDVFMGDVRKVSRLDGREWIAAKDAANDKLIAAKQQKAAAAREGDGTASVKADEAVKKAQEEVDALTGITLPDGSRLDFNDTMILDGKETTVRKFIQEMDADNEALSAVRTCSLPSSSA